MILELDFNRLLVVFDKRYSLSEFRAASQTTPGSYADELVERIHNCLFKHNRDVQEEYKKYYAIEYIDFAEFLYWKYGVDEKVAQRINDRASDGAFVCCGKDSIGIFTDDTFDSVLKHILSELGERGNEDSD